MSGGQSSTLCAVTEGKKGEREKLSGGLEVESIARNSAARGRARCKREKITSASQLGHVVDAGDAYPFACSAQADAFSQ